MAERYDRFIRERKLRVLPEHIVTEKHHILPRSMGGTNSKDNLIELSLREHYIAHLILWKEYGGKMAQAFHMMTSDPRFDVRLTSRQFAEIKKDHSELVSERFKGREVSKETRDKISKARLGKNYGIVGKNHPNYGVPQKPIEFTPEVRKKISDSLKGKKMSEEARKKMSQSAKKRKRKPLSEETKRRISAAQKGRKANPERIRKAWETRKANKLKEEKNAS